MELSCWRVSTPQRVPNNHHHHHHHHHHHRRRRTVQRSVPVWSLFAAAWSTPLRVNWLDPSILCLIPSRRTSARMYSFQCSSRSGTHLLLLMYRLQLLRRHPSLTWMQWVHVEASFNRALDQRFVSFPSPRQHVTLSSAILISINNNNKSKERTKVRVRHRMRRTPRFQWRPTTSSCSSSFYAPFRCVKSSLLSI